MTPHLTYEINCIARFALRRIKSGEIPISISLLKHWHSRIRPHNSIALYVTWFVDYDYKRRNYINRDICKDIWICRFFFVWATPHEHISEKNAIILQNLSLNYAYKMCAIWWSLLCMRQCSTNVISHVTMARASAELSCDTPLANEVYP